MEAWKKGKPKNEGIWLGCFLDVWGSGRPVYDSFVVTAEDVPMHAGEKIEKVYGYLENLECPFIITEE